MCLFNPSVTRFVRNQMVGDGGKFEKIGDAVSLREASQQLRIDWSREHKRMLHWFPSRSLLAAIRQYQHAIGPLAPLSRRIAIERHRLWSIISGADIPVNCQIGGGLMLPHPNGVVIAPDANIGINCIIFQQVTIGTADGGYPTIGDNVLIGAGAKILGPVRIGDGAKIGANAVVLHDVPAGSTAAGIPARVIS